MKKTIGAGSVTIGLLVAGGMMLGSAGLARADTYGSKGDESGAMYALELYPEGMAGTAEQATGLGWQVCAKRTQMSEDDLTSAVSAMYGESKGPAIVFGAEFHFCPQYATGMNAIGDILNGHVAIVTNAPARPSH